MGLIEKSAYLEVGRLKLLAKIVYASGECSLYFVTKSEGYRLLRLALEEGLVSEMEEVIIREQIGDTRMPYEHEVIEELVRAYNLAQATSGGEVEGDSDRLISLLAFSAISPD